MLRPIALRSCVLLFIAASALAAQEPPAQKEPAIAADGIQFTELGIRLYGKFVFESEGELFALVDHESKELVPPGAVLVCIRKNYSIGYYAGGATLTEGGSKTRLPKVFFLIKPSGEVSFHLPGPDANFSGKRLPDTIDFHSKDEAAPAPESADKPQPKPAK